MNTETTTADGVATKDDRGRDVIRFERRFAHPIDKVWAALTERGELIKWWGDATLDLVEGGDFTLRWLNTDEEGNAVAMNATISSLDPPRLLETAGLWAATTEAGDRVDEKYAVLRWELEADGDETVLRFTNILELSDEERWGVPGGWHYHLDALATALDGGSVDLADPWEAAERLHAAYRAKLGSAG
ncbi:MAG: SRPBCC family protein [Solirubrobacterales bacterium]